LAIKQALIASATAMAAARVKKKRIQCLLKRFERVRLGQAVDASTSLVTNAGLKPPRT
jgi:hypothetical protein